MTDRHPKHHLRHLTPVCTPLSSHLNWKLGPATYRIKTSNWNIMKSSADEFQALFSHKLSLPVQMVFFLCKVASFIIFRRLSPFGVAQKLKKIIVINLIHVQSFECTSGYSHLQPTRLIQLPFTNNIHSHLLALLQSNILPRLQLKRPSWWIFHFQNVHFFLRETWHRSRVGMPASESNSLYLCSQLRD